jgi:small-conductance mechanosensitive channel
MYKNFAQTFTHPLLPAVAPASLLIVALIATFLLGHPARPAIAAQSPLRRRFGVAAGLGRWLLVATVALAALLLLGIDLQGLWSTLVAVLSLVAIGFVAMWSMLSHMLASVLILVFRPFELGDRVELVGDDPVVGEVADLNPVYTTLHTDDGGLLRVPNNLFFQKVLKRHAAFPAKPSSSHRS